MLFLRMRYFVILLVLAIGLMIAESVIGYLMLMDSGEKFLAERLFFYGIIALAVVGIIPVRALIFNRQAAKKLDRMIDIVKQSGYLPIDRLAFFGTLGSRMQSMYRELHELGERKSRHIYQLNAVIDKLMEFVQVPLLVVDVTGEIRKTSGGFAGKNKLSSAEVTGKALSDYIKDLDFTALLLEANKTKIAVEIEKEKTKITFYPVLSLQNDVAYFITIFGKHESFAYSGRADEKGSLTAARTKKKALFGFLDLFKKKG
jgi:transcriptional regulator with PAS, ATPase and Fis domain